MEINANVEIDVEAFALLWVNFQKMLFYTYFICIYLYK